MNDADIATLPMMAQQGENQLNDEYRAAIRDSLQNDVQNRQKSMQRRAEQTLIALPNSEKLYDETYISVKAQIVDALKEDGTPTLDFVFDISYNCKHLDGWTDDYPLGRYDWDSSNSVRAICNLTKSFVEREMSDLFGAGKRVSVKIFSTTDGIELVGKIPYNGEYGNFRYMPVTFNGEALRLSVDTSGIANNCQLAYIRAQSVRQYLEQNVRNLQRTVNDYQYVTRSYADTGAQYRRSSIELTVHDAFRETIESVTAYKIQDVQNKIYLHSNFDPIRLNAMMKELYPTPDNTEYISMSLTYQPMPVRMQNEHLQGIQVRNVWYANAASTKKVYLTVTHSTNDGGLIFDYHYQKASLTYDDIEKCYYYMMRILYKGIEEPDMTIGEIITYI